MSQVIINTIIGLIGVVFVGGPVAAWIAFRKDKREEPRDQVETFQKALTLAGDAATAAIAAQASAADAHARASSAAAESAQARADVARVSDDLNIANTHSATQDVAIEDLRTELAAVKDRLQAWMTWGRRIHAEWSNLRQHLSPPPLPETDGE